MANIALLNRCNLACPYCFANSYLATEEEDITREAFEKALEFVRDEGSVGIIGGEPLLHKDFDYFLQLLHKDYCVREVTVFTNGILIDEHLEALSLPKVKVLVNVNSRDDIGSSFFERLDKGIGLLFEKSPYTCVDFGINIYKEGQDFTDFLYLVKKYSIKRVRLSVVIPHNKEMGGIKYFIRMKRTLFALYKELKALNVCPCYDCNAIPECVYTEEEKEILSTLPFKNRYEREIFMGKRSVCSPVIDIYPDLSATRCFGCYDMERVRIEEFNNITDLRNYFFMKIDARLVHSYAWDKCKTCYKHKTFGCFGGCLCYKQ
ncbi:MAG: radical SAM protein [Clostridia bacterium]|nr:radical SAM protein [Clostridia bacterium]